MQLLEILSRNYRVVYRKWMSCK